MIVDMSSIPRQASTGLSRGEDRLGYRLELFARVPARCRLRQTHNPACLLERRSGSLPVSFHLGHCSLACVETLLLLYPLQDPFDAARSVMVLTLKMTWDSLGE